MNDFFSSLAGNERVKIKLQTCLKKNAWQQPFCFQGIDGIGKGLFAKAFARALLSQDLQREIGMTHPDIIEMHPTGKLGLHAVESVRSFCDEVFIAPYESGKKVLIIHEAERMLLPSANTLLKTLEEPPESSVIILLTSSIEKILPTIRSRLRIIYFEPLKADEIIAALSLKEEDEMRVHQAQGSIKRAKLLMKGCKEPALDLIERFLSKNISYPTLKQFLGQVDASMLERKKLLEESLFEQALEPFKECDVSAKQKGDIEKQVEGHVAIDMAIVSQGFLLSLLHFFRDLHVIYHGGQEGFLVHRHLYRHRLGVGDFDCVKAPGSFHSNSQNLNACGIASQVFDMATSKEPPELEKVEEAISKALFALERSIPLTSCIETLFLRLNLV